MSAAVSTSGHVLKQRATRKLYPLRRKCEFRRLKFALEHRIIGKYDFAGRVYSEKLEPAKAEPLLSSG
jgi:hypothetical protein